ncbi:hypothetical protein [Agromyces aerolatus]|uniref:hypothetical protein n=1 Tax=Agromyces sp. LY-1074 TaxID=3074080 RepID=UPI002859C962|nr:MULTISPECIES: hypothetical protein [unclassified Agromyces]MDR5699077.1 hypothetical protein [Agromyces sp. LY-1074]MDR5705145.1 hypothetical protein [Agromyces sp. LY-1358]
MSAESASAAGRAAVPADERAPRSHQPLWLQVGLAVLFGLFYAYDVWEVVESLVQILSLGLTFEVVGWVIMVVAALAPLGLFAAAFAIGRGRSILIAVLAYLTGLAVSGALFSTFTVLLGVTGAISVAG